MMAIVNFFTDGFRFVLLLLFDYLLKMVLPHHQSDSDKIVIIRVDAIGDFVIWLDAAKALEKKFGKNQIILIVNELNLEIASTLSYWGQIVPIQMKKFKNSFKYRYKIIRELNKLNCQKVINTTYSRAFWLDDSIVHHINARQKTGILGDYSNDPSWKLKLSNKWYNRLFKAENQINHEIIRNSEILNQLGIEHTPKIHIIPPETYDNSILEIVPEHYFVVFPGSSTPKKEWGIANFTELINRLTDKYKIPCIICGGLNNIKTNKEIIKNCKEKPIDLTAKTSLKQLISIIKHSGFLVSNDTSAIHIAASTQTPGICVLGGGHFGRFLPYKLTDDGEILKNPIVIYEKMDCFNCNWKCIFQKKSNLKTVYPCIKRIEVECVIKAVVSNIPL
jgi:ADP-heptose:LPS heptosyltransferase